ncbi:MAG: hypothetical protein LBU65_00900 [Planctomycetaceae bacterium]|jgi:hypothetical protein|nr:hypothetical protein [Planctomycetaceae bacterium]
MQINEGFAAVSQDINVLALVKGQERYVFLYNDQNRAETLRVLGRFASNPDLSFTWYDAAVLSQKIRQESQKQSIEQQHQKSTMLPTSLRYNNMPLTTDTDVDFDIY